MKVKPVSVMIKPSTSKGKKKMAVFVMSDGTREIVHFGQAGASDFTQHKDEERKKRYLDRHRTREDWNNPLTAGSLSRWILWNLPTLKDSISNFKKRFKLK
jgi:regulator of PEP synthase PpsR (kinase-PPPase family)